MPERFVKEYMTGMEDIQPEEEDKKEEKPLSLIFLCDVFVPSDTKKLFITSRDKWSAEILVDFLPENCLWVCDEGDEYSEDFVFDLEEISEALPNLTELYMYQTLVANPDSIGNMKNLTSLSYYAIDEVVNGFPARTDSPFTSLKKLKKLRLYGEYTDYSFLNKMTSLEDVYVCMESAASAESLPAAAPPFRKSTCCSSSLTR